MKRTNEGGVEGDEEGLAADGVVEGMKDVAATDETGGGAPMMVTDAMVAEEDGDVVCPREDATFKDVGQKSWAHPRPSASR